MSDFGYCGAWSDELKEAERQRYRAYCKVRCLEASLDRTDWSEFEAVMAELELARAEGHKAGIKVIQLRAAWSAKEHYPH